MRLHAVTSRPMMSKYDPWVNMLRTTVAAFAAGVGGADSVTGAALRQPLGRPDAFGRRIARNTSHLLIDESHVAQVADPAGGSYAVEKLTDDLARAAWEASAEASGTAPTRSRCWPPRSPPPSRSARPRSRSAGDRSPGSPSSPTSGRCSRSGAVRRLGRRPRVRRQLRGAARRPGRGARLPGHARHASAQHTARATFASNLFAAGGVAVDVAGATKGADALAAAYDGQAVVRLAGSDLTYAEWGRAATDALRGAGARRT